MQHTHEHNTTYSGTQRYPRIAIHNKNELAKRISNCSVSYQKKLELINNCIANKTSYWHDNLRISDPKKEKWVRDASYTPLGILLKDINSKILKPLDFAIPNFIYGGVSGRCAKDAALASLGNKRKRTMLKIDMKSFYEQISEKRISGLFQYKFGCGKNISKTIANIVCVPAGCKGSNSSKITLARGFATSSRLAIWANMDFFLRVRNRALRMLKGHNPRVIVYIDDIIITASRVDIDTMLKLYAEINKLLRSDKNQPLSLNSAKSVIINYLGESYLINSGKNARRQYEALGLKLGRNKIYIGAKTHAKLMHAKSISVNSNQLKGLKRYKRYVEAPNDFSARAQNNPCAETL